MLPFYRYDCLELLGCLAILMCILGDGEDKRECLLGSSLLPPGLQSPEYRGLC